MAEKMYSFTHVISESKLFAAISAQADEVRIDITEAPPRKGQRRNGAIPVAALAAPLMLAGPKQGPTGTASIAPHKPMRRGTKGGKSVPQLTLEYLALNKDRIVTSPELEAHAVTHHKKKHAVSVAISVAIKKGWIERVGKGQYKILKEGIAKVGPLDAAAPFIPRTKQTGVGTGNYVRDPKAGTGRALVWDALVTGEPVASAPFHQIYRDHGFDPNAVSNAFASFVKRGFAKKIKTGVFQINKKGQELHAAQVAAVAAANQPQQPATTGWRGAE